MKKILLGLVCLCAATTFVLPLSVSAQNVRKNIAIFVRNDSGNEQLDKNKKNVENILSSIVNNAGFSVVSQDLVLRNLNAYLGDDNAKYRSEAQNLQKKIETQGLDSKLFEDASGLRMGEMIGVDYILSVSISSLGRQEKSSISYGVATKNTILTLRCNYNLSEAGMGVGTAGASVKSQKTIRQSENIETSFDDETINELIEDCAQQMASNLQTQYESNQIIAKQNSESELQIEVLVSAMRFPKLLEENDGSFSIAEAPVPLSLMVINADIDGINYTIDGGKIPLSKGIHYIKIKHKDLEPIEKTINITGKDGQKVVFEGVLTEAAKARMKSDMEWMQSLIERYKEMQYREAREDVDLKIKLNLSSAEADKIRGMAQMYINSGYKLDVKNDTKVDAKNLPDVKNVQSIFGQ